jgi:hypothetical protein
MARTSILEPFEQDMVVGCKMVEGTAYSNARLTKRGKSTKLPSIMRDMMKSNLLVHVHSSSRSSISKRQFTGTLMQDQQVACSKVTDLRRDAQGWLYGANVNANNLAGDVSKAQVVRITIHVPLLMDVHRLQGVSKLATRDPRRTAQAVGGSGAYQSRWPTRRFQCRRPAHAWESGSPGSVRVRHRSFSA